MCGNVIARPLIVYSSNIIMKTCYVYPQKREYCDLGCLGGPMLLWDFQVQVFLGQYLGTWYWTNYLAFFVNIPTSFSYIVTNTAVGCWTGWITQSKKITLPGWQYWLTSDRNLDYAVVKVCSKFWLHLIYEPV